MISDIEWLGHSTIKILGDKVFKKESLGELIVICPPEGFRMNRLEHNPRKLQLCYEIGRHSALEKINQIKEFLKKE